MKFFDDVVEVENNGQFFAIALDSETDEQRKLTMDLRIDTSICSFEGIKLSIVCFPDVYVYRGKLDSDEEAKALSDKIMQLANNVDWKNNSIHSPHNIHSPYSNA
ncbi:hypothetical protein HC752_11605 [Vibrio sp. S9_S30]|uniref:hypothetical protein n=1 Tax=Vibrio sp. S9_S30 TaxID=2720226 RepID=UPI0016817B39|nr:hypothetical protein [Vibrio sp. S9_S30]MBD1557576.1 hypothetical protein [Vibrio sp. S9_S30]